MSDLLNLHQTKRIRRSGSDAQEKTLPWPEEGEGMKTKFKPLGGVADRAIALVKQECPGAPEPRVSMSQLDGDADNSYFISWNTPCHHVLLSYESYSNEHGFRWCWSWFWMERVTGKNGGRPFREGEIPAEIRRVFEEMQNENKTSKDFEGWG